MSDKDKIRMLSESNERLEAACRAKNELLDKMGKALADLQTMYDPEQRYPSLISRGDRAKAHNAAKKALAEWFDDKRGAV